MGSHKAGCTGLPLPAADAPVLGRIAVVLHQPEDVVNVGGVVRVMTNFGLSQLRLVEPAAFDAYRIEGIAHRGGPIVEAVRRYPSLEQALADCGFVLATTGRPREVERDRLTPRQAATALLAAARAQPDGNVAVLFGRERDGLPNTAIDLCHALVTIPTDPENHSLNLSHAAAIVLYEVYLAWLASGGDPAPEAGDATAPQTWPPLQDEPDPVVLRALLHSDARLARGAEREAMFHALADLLEALYPHTAFARRYSALARLRAILLRAVPQGDEAALLNRLFRHLARVARSYGARSGEPGR